MTTLNPAAAGGRIYVACMVDGKESAVRGFRFDAVTGALTPEGQAAGGAKNPLFIMADRSGRVLYVADFFKEPDGKLSGAVHAYAITADGSLRDLGGQYCGGECPCFVDLTHDGRFALVANYADGSVAMLPVRRDGGVEALCDRRSHKPADQPEAKPKAHSIVVDPTGDYALAADLGVDRIFSYRIDRAAGKLTPNDPPYLQTRQKSGPRHLAFHPNGKLLYVITELDNTVMAMSYDAAGGKLTVLQTEPSLPPAPGSIGKNYGADLRVHPNGRFVYASNRGHDSVVIFAIDPASGKMTLVGHQLTGGQCPRGFAIDPTGKYLIVANEKSNELAVFRVDGATGKLTDTGQRAAAPKPAGLCFV